MWIRLRLLACIAAFVVLATACQVELDVAINVESDGAGEVELTVTLDDEAARKIPNLEDDLRVDDLRAADWDISSFEEIDRDEETWTEITATKRFSSPEQLQEVLDEITGSSGMFNGFTIRQESDFAERRYSVDGEVDLRRGLALFSDQQLTFLLGGEEFGRPIDEFLEGRSPDEAISVDVEVTVPGEGDGGSGSRVLESPEFADPEPTTIALRSIDDVFAARVLRWVAMAGFALFGLSVVLGLLAFFLERRARKKRGVGTPGSVASRVPGMEGAGAAGGPQRQMRMVCLDPLGVLYNVGPDPGDLLVSFIRSRGSNASRSKIDELHAKAMLGRISTAELWEGVNVQGAADDLDAAYIELIEPRNGAAEFLREMRRREVPVTCVTNDVSAWSRRLRERDNLAMIWPWIISADVGVQKPDTGIYEALRRESGVPYESCLLIDNNADHLDTAKTLGMSTAFFTTKRPPAGKRPSHPIVTSFADFFRSRS